MNWKFIGILLGTVVILVVTLSLIVPPVSANNYYVQQGDTIYIGEHVDISGVAQGIVNLAYYDGFDCYGDTQFLLPMPKTKSGYYNFYVDPDIFGNKTGVWCKWNGYVESNGNLNAFTVLPEGTHVSKFNTSIQNPNQTPLELPKQPLLPIRHVSDYLIARGDGFKIPVNGSTDAWIFGARDSLLDYQSFRNTVNLTADAINTLSPGLYKVLLHVDNSTSATVRYNNASGQLQWFDPKTFTIQGYAVTDNTPENVLAKLETIYNDNADTYVLFNLEVQDPTITIDQIDSLNQLNDTSAPQAQGIILGSQSYIDVRGYTNAAPDTIVKVAVDADFNALDPWDGAIVTKTEGDIGGDMREWKALIPLKLYDMKPGRHFVSAKTGLSDEVISTADFYIYDNPSGNLIPNKTIRYVSGRYGPDEMVPTPTPIVLTQVVTQVVTQTILVPVTPSNEQVYAEQKKAAEATYWEGVRFWSIVLVVGGFLIGGGAYSVSVIRRMKD